MPVNTRPGTKEVPPAIANPILDLNRACANQLLEEVHRNPQSPYANKKIGIVNGQIVIVADSWREVACELRRVESDPAKRFCIDTGVDHSKIEEIFEVSCIPLLSFSFITSP